MSTYEFYFRICRVASGKTEYIEEPLMEHSVLRSLKNI